MKMSLFIIVMAFVSSAFADSICYESIARNLVDSLNKNDVATLCADSDRADILNRILNCYESPSGLIINHMVKHGGVFCVAVSRSKTK